METLYPTIEPRPIISPTKNQQITSADERAMRAARPTVTFTNLQWGLLDVCNYLQQTECCTGIDYVEVSYLLRLDGASTN